MITAQRLTDRKREAIIQAAITEFRENGFDATSMDRIAARAAVSKRTVYNHFPGKEELFSEMLARLWESSQEALDRPYCASQPLRVQLLTLVQEKMKMLNNANFMDLARVAVAEAIHSPERARDMIGKLGEREESIQVWIRAAQADGQLKAVDAGFAACQLQALIKAFAFWPQITMGQPPLSEAMQVCVVNSAVDMFLGEYRLTAAP
jgi:TetR/AcrR family transcriptional regulator of autoinduction and epiphytic fitness